MRLQRILRRQHRQKMRRTRLNQNRYNSRHYDPLQRFMVRHNERQSPENEKFLRNRSNRYHKRPNPHPTFNHKKKQRASQSKIHSHFLPFSKHRKNTYLNKKILYPVRSQSLNQQSYRHRYLNLDQNDHYSDYNHLDTPYLYTGYQVNPSLLTSFKLPHIDDFLQARKKPEIERQGAFIAATPLTYGAAWFGSMVGLAAIVRAPLSEVLTRFSPWSVFNGMLK